MREKEKIRDEQREKILHLLWDTEKIVHLLWDADKILHLLLDEAVVHRSSPNGPLKFKEMWNYISCCLLVGMSIVKPSASFFEWMKCFSSGFILLKGECVKKRKLFNLPLKGTEVNFALVNDCIHSIDLATCSWHWLQLKKQWCRSTKLTANCIQ